MREREESNILSQTGLNKQTNKASNKNYRYTSVVECLPSLSKAMGLILSIAGIKGNDLNMLFILFFLGAILRIFPKGTTKLYPESLLLLETGPTKFPKLILNYAPSSSVRP